MEECARVQTLAGAIALAEATEAERDEYRRHLARCPDCCERLGGERELERTASVVAQAREIECWEPGISVPQMLQRHRMKLRTRIAVCALPVAAAVAIVAGVRSMPHSAVRPVEKHVAAVPAEHVEKPQSHAARKIFMVHNVVTLSAPAPTAPPTERPATPKVTAARSAPVPEKSVTRIAEEKPPAPVPVPATRRSAPASDVPIWRRNEPLPIATPAPIVGQAESIAVAPVYVIRDAMPIGGENAIEPQPPMIAYAERAQGTTAFDVAVNERGIPTKCTITKSSGYLSLDGAVCKAAMKARYFPKTINGRAVAGIYRDAFTFRQSDNEPEFP
jgi:TonB family protein